MEVTSDQEVSSVHWPTAADSNGKPQLQKPLQQELISVKNNITNKDVTRMGREAVREDSRC